MCLTTPRCCPTGRCSPDFGATACVAITATRRSRPAPFTEQLKAKSRKRRDGQARIQAAKTTSNPARNDLAPPLTLVDLPLDALRLPARKVRAIDEAHVQEIARAIASLGFCAPILIGKDNLVLDGQSRVEAARRLGLTQVPCIRVEHLGEKEQRLLRLAVNRVGEKGRWNLEELKLEFEELILEEAPIEISGFTRRRDRSDRAWRRGVRD